MLLSSVSYTKAIPERGTDLMDGRTRCEMMEVIVLMVVVTTGTYNSAELNITQKNITIFILTTETSFVKTVSREKMVKTY